jgi:predicted helicase
LHRELSDIGAALGGRLNVFLADTLAPAEGTERVTPHLAFLSGPIVMERRLADEVKSSRPILAIIGNPPYRRLAEGETAELVSRWVAEVLWEDFKRPVRNAGWGGELNTFPDLYVAFYRWALWKLFERPGADGRGVLCFITNRTFLTGHPYAGVRQVLRQRFSEIRIVDLRGDNRAPRPAGIEEDQCVFNIEAGVCILIAYADGNPQNGQLGIVSYADIWEHGCFTKADKLRFLEECAAGEGQLNFVGIDRGPLDDFRPRPFEGKAWPSLEHLFLDKSLGVQTKRDDFVYRPTRRLLEDSIRNALTSSNPEQYQDRFNDTGMRSFSRARLHPFDVANVRVISYRPLDRRYLYDHAAFIDRPRPLLRSLWGASNVGLYTLPAGVGKGPAVVVCGHLPDYHAFRGSYGGYAFPLDDRRPGGHPFNLAAALIESLSRLYGYSVEAPEVFDFVVGVLSATSYSRRFASDLQDAFPHVPFPRDGAHFRFVAGIGARIRQLEAFQARPDQRYQTARLEGTAIHHVIICPRWHGASSRREAGSGPFT